MKLIRLLVVVCSGIVAGGCGGSGTDVQPGLTGRYDLSSIEDRALPFTLSTGIDGSRFQVIGGEFSFRSRNMVLDIVRYQRTSGSGEVEPEIVDTLALPYTHTATQLILVRRRPDDTTFPDTMEIVGSQMFGVRALRSVIGNYTGAYRVAYTARN